jgi:hypothetical protein
MPQGGGVASDGVDNGYYTWAKRAVGAFYGSFLLYLVTYAVVGVPENADISNYPTVGATVVLFLLALVVGYPLFVWAAYRDKQYRAGRVADVTTRHWLTIAAFVYFSMGFYSLYYLYARKTAPLQSTAGPGDTATGGGAGRPAPTGSTTGTSGSGGTSTGDGGTTGGSSASGDDTKVYGDGEDGSTTRVYDPD